MSQVEDYKPPSPRFRVARGMRRVRLLLGGWTFGVMVFLYLPIGLLVLYSFNDSKLNVKWEGFTTKWYQALVRSDAEFMTRVDPQIHGDTRELLEAMKNSVIIALWVTVLSVLLGTAGAWLLYRYRYRFKGILNTLLFVPLVVPEVVMGISLLLMFAVVNATGNQALNQIGLAGNPLSLGFTTIVIAHVTFCFPFVLIAVQARLAGMDPALEEAAMDLGATPLRAFRSVIVPYLLPAILSGALMAFTLSMDEYIVTYFVKSADSQTMPIKVYGLARKGLNPMLNAVSTLFIVGTALLVVAAEGIKRWRR